MQSFDIVVVGAGPAGGHCARTLAKNGYRVLLAEQHSSFEINNFSSAATPLKTLELFNLPEQTIGSVWDKLTIVSSNARKTWTSPEPLGVVFDFAKLRQFLADEVTEAGSEVWMGYRYFKHYRENGETIAEFKRKGTTEPTRVKTKVLVDATGSARAVMYPQKRNRPSFSKATGIEYLIEVEPYCYRKLEQELVFFLGSKWIPQGYSWVFPMEGNRLKIGVARYYGKHAIAPVEDRFKNRINLITKNYLNLEDNYQLIDVHGSTLCYSMGLKDVYYRDNTIAIGDSVSTFNFLGGEGIRYAMLAGEVAARYIGQYVKGEIGEFDPYRKELRNYFLRRWQISERIAKKVYFEYDDRAIDRGVSYIGSMNLKDAFDILFEYKFEKATQGILPLLKRQWIAFLQSIRERFDLNQSKI
jgi:digeranylgeranylglycerophospholipid reductase